MNNYLGRDKIEKKESVVGAIKKYKVEERENSKKKSKIFKETKR